MSRKQYRYTTKTSLGKWRVQIRDAKRGHPPTGTYNDEYEAAVAADRYIVDVLEPMHDDLIDRWTLNFPDQWPPYNVRRKQNALKRGDWHTLYGDDPSTPTPQSVATTPAPVEGRKKKEPTPQEKFEKRWHDQWEDQPDTDKLFPGGKNEWMALGASIEWDVSALFAEVGKRRRAVGL